ncbi:MAG: glycosyltransferase family 9 protein, partial [Acetobacteraceae bacterium]
EIEGFRDESERDQPLPVIPDLAACAGRSVLIRREQGRGDVLHFIRYAALLARHASRVSLATYPDQVALLARTPGLAEAAPEDGPEPAHDLAVSLLSLPLIFSTTVETIPADVPYLIADPAAVGRWRSRLPPARRRVGLCWWGSAHSRRSSIPLASLAPLLDLPDIGFHALQIELPPDQRALALRTGRPALHDAELPDFDATAALIGALDLVITIDTSVAHLAGGMGRPVWILLRDSPDWRWMQGRADSPWYPTARLFRQGPDRDWTPVVAAVRAALAAWADTPGG